MEKMCDPRFMAESTFSQTLSYVSVGDSSEQKFFTSLYCSLINSDLIQFFKFLQRPIWNHRIWIFSGILIQVHLVLFSASNGEWDLYYSNSTEQNGSPLCTASNTEHTAVEHYTLVRPFMSCWVIWVSRLLRWPSRALINLYDRSLIRARYKWQPYSS